MKRLLLGASALALTAGFTGAAQAEFSLRILHINDFHSRFESITATDSNCNAEGEQKGECFGGVARLKTEIDLKKQEAKSAWLEISIRVVWIPLLLIRLVSLR